MGAASCLRRRRNAGHPHGTAGPASVFRALGIRHRRSQFLLPCHIARPGPHRAAGRQVGDRGDGCCVPNGGSDKAACSHPGWRSRNERRRGSDEKNSQRNFMGEGRPMGRERPISSSIRLPPFQQQSIDSPRVGSGCPRSPKRGAPRGPRWTPPQLRRSRHKGNSLCEIQRMPYKKGMLEHLPRTDPAGKQRTAAVFAHNEIPLTVRGGVTGHVISLRSSHAILRPICQID